MYNINKFEFKFFIFKIIKVFTIIQPFLPPWGAIANDLNFMHIIARFGSFLVVFKLQIT